ncbi:hypothetical protein ACFFP0_15610 [Rhizobium puerariae]|uniref:Uncharacterized protein n=1 Tax=Rhizobium puerariae TaxID=1585791 RepID=A0ABV6AI70_9HYPH
MLDFGVFLTGVSIMPADGDLPPAPPAGYVFLTDDDGAYLTDDDHAFLMEFE